MAEDLKALTVEKWKAGRKELESRIRGRIADSQIQKSIYSTNAGLFEERPLAVITPENEDDIRTIIAFCRDNGIPVTARGAGTSVTDAALGRGVVLDLSRKMNSIISVDLEHNIVNVQAGITLDQLNRELAKYGRTLPLRPFKGMQCTAGGCIAVNAGGMLSGRFGRIAEMVETLRVVLSDGTAAECTTERGDITNEILNIAAGASGAQSPARLFIGSEGQTGIIVSAALRMTGIIPPLKVRAYFYRSLRECIDSAFSGKFAKAWSAIFMDALLMSALAYRLDSLAIPREAEGCIVAVGEGNALPRPEDNGAMSSLEIAVQPEALYSAVTDSIHTLSRPVPNGRYTVMVEGFRLGKNAAAFCNSIVGAAENSRTQKILFGECLSGTVYFRPFLNMAEENDRLKHSALLSELVEAAAGMDRGAQCENGMGMMLWNQFQRNGMLQFKSLQVAKTVVDPTGILNPCSPSYQIRSFRGSASAAERGRKNMLIWNLSDIQSVTGRGPLDFGEETDACHGCGECRTMSFLETQCPVYRSIGGEITSPRGMNNLIRSVYGGYPGNGIDRTSEEYAKSIYDYCVQCKMCVVECPSNVNTAKVLMEARARYVRDAGVKSVRRASKFFSDYEFYTVVASSVATLSNRLIRSRKVRSVLEHAFGVDRRRKIPDFDTRTFSEWFRRHESPPGPRGNVVYFSDIFANYFDSATGIATTALLEAMGYSVMYPRQRFTGLPLIYLGMLREARRYVFDNASFLYPYTSKGIKIVCSSPSAVMALRHDYLSVLDDDRARVLSTSVLDIAELLYSSVERKEFEPEMHPFNGVIHYFPSCHARALRNDRKTERLLRLIPSEGVDVIGEGCCGAGGSYGFAKETFSMSMDIGSRLFRTISSSIGEDELVVTEGEECALQIYQGTGRRVVSPVKLLASHLLQGHSGNVQTGRIPGRSQ